MSRGTLNLSNISNNDLVLLRQVAKKHSKVSVRAGSKKFEVEGTQVSIISGVDGLSFVSIPATSAIYKDGKLVSDESEVKDAIRVLKQTGRKSSPAGSNRATHPEIPEELRKQLAAFAKQNNSRVIFDPTSPSGYKVQKLRPRQKGRK